MAYSLISPADPKLINSFKTLIKCCWVLLGLCFVLFCFGETEFAGPAAREEATPPLPSDEFTEIHS